MDVDELRSLQSPLKRLYREDADAALIVLKAAGAVDEAEIACSVDTGRALVEAGLHPSGGGSGLQACSGDMLLQALVACAGVTLKAVATALSIDIRHARLSAEGDLDVRGTLGVDRGAPVGFRAIRLHIDLASDADAGGPRPPLQAHRALLRRLPDPRRRHARDPHAQRLPRRRRPVGLKRAGSRRAVGRRAQAR